MVRCQSGQLGQSHKLLGETLSLVRIQPALPRELTASLIVEEWFTQLTENQFILFESGVYVP